MRDPIGGGGVKRGGGNRGGAGKKKKCDTTRISRNTRPFKKTGAGAGSGITATGGHSCLYVNLTTNHFKATAH